MIRRSSVPGRFVAVVGPSGVGKDSVMAGLSRAIPALHIVRRVITRAPGQSGEDYDAVCVTRFEAMVRDGSFAVHWQAHGLLYGIPATVEDRLKAGTDCLANLSRGALTQAVTQFPRLSVLHITARPRTLARRLHRRGRETEEQIAERLAQSEKLLPPGLHVIQLSNDGPLAQTVARGAALLYPESV